MRIGAGQGRAATAEPASQHIATRWRICARMRRLIATGARPPSYPDICAAPREGPMDEITKASAVPHRPERRGFDAVQFSGEANALFERHLRFDSVVDPAVASARDKFEAAAHAVRDLLTQRWIQTQQAYDRENPKRVYYLSMEFLIGRSLTNNITNLMLHSVVGDAARAAGIDWLGLVEQEPDAGLGNGGLGRLAACFLDSMATMQLPAMGYGLRYEYGMFRQTIENGWQCEHPDNWLRQPDPWEVARPQETVEVELGCSFKVHKGTLRAVFGNPSTVLGVPYDRPIVGYGGQTITTLRLWAAATSDVFDLKAFSTGAFVTALAQRLAADSITRVLYP